METKRQDEAVFDLYKGSDFVYHYTVPPVGLSGGLALSWKKEIKLEVLFSSANVIDTKLQINDKTVFVSFIYGAPQQGDRAKYWEDLSVLGDQRESPWLLTGDFNDLLDNSEKVGGPLRWERSFLAFRNFVSKNGLWDLQFSGNSLSWRGTRYSHHIKSRLDRAMANLAWFEQFPSGRSEYLRFEGSDHRPLLTHFDQNLIKKKGVFRFDRRLREKPEIRQLVEETWNSVPSNSVLTKINEVRRNIVEWTKKQAATSKELIISTQVLLEEALSDTTPDLIRIETLSQTLEKAYEDEESYWRQRSRIQWLSCGDRNSNFFHAVTRGRRACNKFSVIETEEGQAFYEEKQITVQDALSCKISDEMNLALIAILDNQEIKRVNFGSKKEMFDGEAKTRVKRELNISNEGGIGKYLGLPENFGRKKRDIFASIVDRIRQSHSWTTRYLSGAGKMVLLKAHQEMPLMGGEESSRAEKSLREEWDGSLVVVEI
ncbi:hypothetical protein Bca52824_065377 [Brassica carinata]|uniref:Endonuclease/exonuclease/phosphatase domain-containing protein n=1 Tax=Brassica carinata TaxID=52824 RepID=A0A8X7QK78_BRACI|nr:hypothetical protein Bca52824_065377 [Brassica carinata]